MFAEDFVNDRNKKEDTVIHERPKGIIVRSRSIFVNIVIRVDYLPKEILDVIIHEKVRGDANLENR